MKILITLTIILLASLVISGCVSDTIYGVVTAKDSNTLTITVNVYENRGFFYKLTDNYEQIVVSEEMFSKIEIGATVTIGRGDDGSLGVFDWVMSPANPGGPLGDW